jgi:transcriptional regulator with XRE-family HTH domain
VDDLAIGRLFRELRVRLGWPQAVVARKAGLSQAAYSRIERGLIDRSTLGTLRKVATVLEVRLVVDPRWRGAAVDRLTSTRHAAMTETVVRTLLDAGWTVQPEVSFNHYGERGVVDIVAWHAATETLLLIELKTEIADVNALLAVRDRRRRLAARIADPFGWQPKHVGEWIVVAESRTNRRRVAEHASSLRAALPSDGRSVAAWLANPRGSLSALSFLSNSHEASPRQSFAPRLRVHRGTASVGNSTDRA